MQCSRAFSYRPDSSQKTNSTRSLLVEMVREQTATEQPAPRCISRCVIESIPTQNVCSITWAANRLAGHSIVNDRSTTTLSLRCASTFLFKNPISCRDHERYLMVKQNIHKAQGLLLFYLDMYKHNFIQLRCQ